MPEGALRMRRLMMAAIMVAACGAGASAFAQGVIEKEKEKDIRRLLEVTGAGRLGAQMIENSLAELRKAFASLPPEMRERALGTFESEMRKEFTAERMVEMALPIYDKYLSVDDLKGALAFYESPTGKKIISVLPQITQESWKAGAARGEEVGRRVIKQLQAEGVIPTQPDAPPPAAKPPAH